MVCSSYYLIGFCAAGGPSIFSRGQRCACGFGSVQPLWVFSKINKDLHVSSDPIIFIQFDLN